ncbi:MAG: BREX-1 system adenine-specific DNA-methyltransferase PglX [Deltaproteobacteria bacterium]|nr:BREX-1 system adenine-specific DNA-methyltransferase PglX [Deltaproteobacteria bacterium]
MDKDTRNRIQRATQAARDLLEHEYAEQLEGVFDIRLDGTVAAEPGEHLDAAQRVVRTKLVTAVEHQRAGGMTKADAVAAYLREAAFTTLNRFVALKMLEARDLVQECISSGDQSAGFKEFTGLAPGLVQLPDHGYRMYIESLFDEVGREVRVLFDRRDPASLLWPRRQGLLDLLAILNASDLGPVWGEDETIGWVYQYFNSDDERKAMRAESQAPRNSRELAVRNQFFTPRYVVRFLTDNTLGRIWYEMRQGQTKLCDLKYLVRRLNESFLAEGEPPPHAGDEGLTQEGMLQRPVQVPFRAKRDPRDIRVLDPACGSGHFLLYAFDLLLTIYEEAWADEASPPREATGRTLRDDYLELSALRTAAPGLILRHNLHGIDIDARCAQIAALALWMRAQRAYKDAGISRDDRLAIEKTNIVVAEPMPGEEELRREFIASLDKDLGKLVHRVFDSMQLAGDAGSLLKIEEIIQSAVRDVYGQTGELFKKSDDDRWRSAESALERALIAYAEQPENDAETYRRRLFAGDAAQGLGLVDLCRQQYAVVLMNPPFGRASEPARQYLYESTPVAAQDLLAAFVERFSRLLEDGGRLGAITGRLALFKSLLEDWRSEFFLGATSHLRALVDLGYGVLDSAMVEAAAYVTERRATDINHDFFVADATATTEKEAALNAAIPEGRFRDASAFSKIPGKPIAHGAPRAVLDTFVRTPSITDTGFRASSGAETGDNFRFLRCFWEVPGANISPLSEWTFAAKGGEYNPWTSDVHLVLDYGQLEFARRAADTDLYALPGITWTGRTTSNASFRVLPGGCIPTRMGQLVWKEGFPKGALALLGFLNSTVALASLEIAVGGGDASVAGSAARHFLVAHIRSMPCVLVEAVEELTARLYAEISDEVHDEMSPRFTALFLPPGEGLQRSFDEFCTAKEADIRRAWGLWEEIQQRICDSLGWSSDTWNRCALEVGHVPLRPANRAQGSDVSSRAEKKLTFSVEPSLERHLLAGGNVEDWQLDRDDNRGLFAWRLLSWAVGCALGRWRTEAVCTERQRLSAPLQQLPTVSSALTEHESEGIAVDDPGLAQDIVALAIPAMDVALPGKETFELAVRWLGGDGVREFLRDQFFDRHLTEYSKSRRKAPIYWQLATLSSGYSIWIYYHSLTADTFYRVLNDYVKPRLKHEERKLTSLSQDVVGNLSAGQRNELDAQECFVGELRAFLDDVSLVAPLWNPNLNDGVIINFAPLWRLVPQHRAWQKECKSTWDKLRTGDYDWAHLAMHLWPERVVPKCAKDRSLAVAHGLDDVFWYEDSDGNWQARKVDRSDIDKLVKDRTSAAVKDALKSLLEAPAPTTGRATRKKAPRAKGTRKRAASARPKAATNGASSSGRSSAAVDDELLSKVKEAIAATGDGASKTDVVNATGITASEWNKAIKALLADGSVTQTGERRGARYHLAGGEA